MLIAAAVSVGVLAVVCVVILRELRLVGDKLIDNQLYVAFIATAVYLVIVGAEFDEYVISLAALRFAVLMWDVVELAKMRIARQITSGR